MPASKTFTSQQRKIIATYSRDADALTELYENLCAEDVHADWKHHLPKAPGLVLDIGAGSGRDAAWLSSYGFDVVAVEPALHLREKAQEIHRKHAIQWLDDSLPELTQIKKLNYRYDFILISAVFMHLLSEDSRQRAFRKLASQLKPGGKMVITLRHGPAPAGRTMADVTKDDIFALARNHALETVHFGESSDRMSREDVSWSFVVLQLPDDGTGALPLLRHLILLDSKSSTYKLALLRVLIRIADSCRGAVLKRDDHYVTLPLGLVALYWLKVYKPLLVENNFQQQQSGKKCGFVNDNFYQLRDLGHELRVGAVLSSQRAQILIKALRDAIKIIHEMPAKHLTIPGSSEQVFPIEKTALHHTTSTVTIDLDFLKAFGHFQVPIHLWETMTHYACWLEPAITHEWCLKMQGYHQRQGEEISLGTLYNALTWKNDERSTSQVRRIIDQMKRKHLPPNCVWSGDSLARKQFEVDHCFPYASWFNNDLWNLMPATKQVNGQKSNKLPTGELLLKSKSRILEWWEQGYETSNLKSQFYTEATASLSGIKNASLEAVFEGVVQQRLHLKYEQRMPEWQNL